MTPTSLPLYLVAQEPATRDRTTALVRLIMVIPQYIVLFFLSIAATVVVVIGWFAALITGELPVFAYDFLSGVLRWEARVVGYLFFLTDDYPPFSLEEEPQYGLRVAIPPRTQLNRVAVLFRIFLAIPGAIVAAVVMSGVFVVSIASWAIIVFTGSMPEPLYEAVRVGIRYHVRFSGYFGMLTPEYSWGVLGDLPDGTGTPALPGAGDPAATALPAADPASSGPVDPGWLLRLSPEGRTATIAVIVIGVVVEVVRFAAS